jgi:hypothetical protein
VGSATRSSLLSAAELSGGVALKRKLGRQRGRGTPLLLSGTNGPPGAVGEGIDTPLLPQPQHVRMGGETSRSLSGVAEALKG